MDYIVSTVVTATGLVMSFSYYPQAWRIFKKKSSEDIALSTFSILAVGTAIWFFYGLYKNDWVIIVSFIFGVVGSWLVLFLTLYYRRADNKKGL